ncbi:MAG: hypothetical protein ACFBSC_04275 [Microcoleaceae cyanobacterium]
MKQESITIHIPADLYEEAQQLPDSTESFDEMAIRAISQEVRRRKALAAHQRIIARSAEVETQTGIQRSSVDLIRQLRAGEERRD